jgi:hypothetical protein
VLYLCGVKKESLFIFGVLLVLFISFVGQNQKVYIYLFDNANFTEKHCVNKDAPEMQCNGACQLNDNQNKDEPVAPNPLEYRAFDLFLCDPLILECFSFSVTSEKNHFSQRYELLKKKEKILVPPPNGVV